MSKQMKPLKVKTLQELFRNKNRWIKDAAAAYRVPASATYKAQVGKPNLRWRLKRCDPTNKKAEVFCLLGGLHRVYRKRQAFEDAAKRLSQVILSFTLPGSEWSTSIVGFNDHTKTTIQHIRQIVKKAKV